jgi:hypothetical protein
MNCPNYSDHCGKRLSIMQFVQLIRAQLARDIEADADCQPLYLSGARGSLFKIRLSSHGYTLVAKGVERLDSNLLRHEENLYNQLINIQGVHVPVCLGIADLIKPYYHDCGIYTSFLLLSWAGQPLARCINAENSEHLQNKAVTAFKAIHQSHVLHHDAEIRNIVYDQQNDKLIVVDFERAEIQDRQVLQPISANYASRKRKRAVCKLEDDVSDKYKGEQRCIIKCFAKFM